MPSLHVAWAVWVALAVVVAWPRARMSALAWLYPVVSTLVVLGTGNHFLMDAVAGAALVAAAAWVVGNAQPFLPAQIDLREPAGGGPAHLPFRRTDH